MGTVVRTVSVAQRRRALVRRHHLAGDAEGPEAVTRALLALHATDPGSVHLSVLARSAGSTLADVSAATYERRSLVRWMAMRRTLFVLPVEDVPVVQAAVSTPLAAALRRRLVSRIERNGTDPSLDPAGGGAAAWLVDLEGGVERALRARGSATGAQLSTDVPALRTTLLPGAPSERPQTLTSTLLTLASAEGRMVRATPTGAWTSRSHRWEPVERWWPGGLPVLDRADAQRTLARRWLERFGPATTGDLQWWTGWTLGETRRALAAVGVEEVDLHGVPGVALLDDPGAGDADPAGAGPLGDAEPVAALLPALDPTAMGWKRREWYLSAPAPLLFDRAGNIGPTAWWGGEVVGGWAVGPDGDVRTRVVVDRGEEAARAVRAAARRLRERLGGAVVVPAARTPLERELAEGPPTDG